MIVDPAEMWAWAPDALGVLVRYVLAVTVVMLSIGWGVKHLRQVSG